MSENNKSFQDVNVEVPSTGMVTDISILNSPKGSYKYSLNSVLETDRGDLGYLSNEESNKEYTQIPEGFSIIGKCYTINNEVVLFLVNPNTNVSEIGILDDKGNYTTYVNDSNTTNKEDKLNFSIVHQIQATYRLRRGCDRNIYWTDGFNKPRVINLDALHNYKNENAEFISSKFNIFKTIDKLPQLDESSLQVLEGYGQLKPGSYSILVQYLDSDFNPTQFIELVNNIIIYEQSFNTEYGEIEGSIHIDSTEDKYQSLITRETNKAIKVNILENSKNFNFKYLRYAFVEYTSGTGQASRVNLSEPLPLENTEFTYTGNNAATSGSLEEIKLFGEDLNIETAKHIEQIDNRLILANIESKQINVQRLQKYASKIKADCRVRPINLNTLGERKNNYNNKSNPKHPLVNSNGVGYQPGEIYAFGIVYIYKDGTTSPVFHIPGKSTGDRYKDVVYEPGQGIYPMSNVNNESSTRYVNTSNCDNFDYWGKDGEGLSLNNKKVRFHRFPTRQELGLSMITQSANTTSNSYNTRVNILQVIGNLKSSVVCNEGDTSCTPYQAIPFTIELKYNLNGIEKIQSLDINPDDSNINTINISDLFLESDNITDYELKYYDGNNINGIVLQTSVKTNPEFKQLLKDTYGSSYVDPGIDYSIENKIYVAENSEIKFAFYEALDSTTLNENNLYSNIFGIKFSNIEIPNKEDIGVEIIGYQIVRLDRELNDYTVVDTGVITPISKYNNKVAFSTLTPEVKRDGDTNREYHVDKYISKDKFNIISLKHRFLNLTPDSSTKIKEVGSYGSERILGQAILLQDVLDGSSADGISTTKGTGDDDGWTLKNIFRFNKVKYEEASTKPIDLDLNKNSNLEFRFYNLNPVNYATDILGTTDIYNTSTDERALILNTKNGDLDFYKEKNRFPYVYFIKEHDTFYSNFRNRAYQLCDSRVFKTNTCEVFGGDTYLSPLRFSSMQYMTTYQAIRRSSQSFWKRWLKPLGSVVAGLALAVFTGGSSLLIAAGTLMALGGITLGIASNIEMNKFREVYTKKWSEGLSRVCRDLFAQWLFVNPNQPQGWEQQLPYRDDTIGWLTDSIGDIWLESPINANLRISPKAELTYLKPQTKYPEHDNLSLMDASHVFHGKIGETSLFKWRAEKAWMYSDKALENNKKEILLYTKKITKQKDNPTQKSDTDYVGVPVPTFYFINPDYNYIKRLKYFYHLPLSFDFCSKCIEKFPHRIHYSEQSFQEERTDNYTKFLPNNYRDIEGETGEITNVFRLNSNLYIHTEEALWLQPRSYQERITDQIVSFIGTGSFFEIPPQKIIDDETGQSAGTTHKWASLKTPMGYFFVSENQGKIYQFDGKYPKPISDLGMSNWFERNIKIKQDFEYFKNKKEKYPFRNNPSNINGSGYISTYDNINNRVIFSKKDSFINLNAYGKDFEISNKDNNLIIFPNISRIISEKSQDNWRYLGIENGQMKFIRDVVKTRKEKRLVRENIFKDVDYILFRYNFSEANGKDLDTRTQVIEPFVSRIFGWGKTTNEEGLHLSKYIKWGGDNTGYGREMILLNLKEFKKDYPDLKEFKFTCRAFWYALRGDGNMNMNAQAYKGGCPVHIGTNTNFCNTENNRVQNLKVISTIPLLEDVKINYNQSNTSTPSAFEFRIDGGELQGEYNFPTENIVTRNNSNIEGDLVGTFTYNIEKGELSWEGKGSGGHIPPTTREVEIEVDVEYIDYEYLYLDGEIVDVNNIENNSWTISYSLVNSSWISYHNYNPNIYINIPNRFFSWVYGNNNIWEHNIKGSYQTFYNKHYPHIIEYVINNNPGLTKITNTLQFQTEAKTYNENIKSYVDDLYTTFNKAVLYNTRQCSGLINLQVKDLELYDEDYMLSQVYTTNNNVSIIDRTERDWYLNDFRDYRIDYNQPIWNNDSCYHFKILNEQSISYSKDWTQQESFRDKYLGVRLIFDKFANKKLITNLLLDVSQVSQH